MGNSSNDHDHPDFLFPHQIPAYLHISRTEFGLLKEFSHFPDAQRLEGTCVFYYLTAEIDKFVQRFETRKAFEGHIDYLSGIDRAE
jgi:hypothetical protein